VGGVAKKRIGVGVDGKKSWKKGRGGWGSGREYSGFRGLEALD